MESLQKHVVSRNETLQGISLKYNIPIARIRELNHLTRDTLYSGQQILLPSSGISRECNDSKIEQPQTNGPPYSFLEHQVAPNETISSIALIYQMKVSDLKKYNNIKGCQLEPGTILKVISPQPTQEKRTRSLSGHFSPVDSPKSTLIDDDKAQIQDERCMIHNNFLHPMKLHSDPTLHSNPKSSRTNVELVEKRKKPSKAPVSVQYSSPKDLINYHKAFSKISVENIFEEFRTQGPEWQSPHEVHGVYKEPARYLLANIGESILGICTLSAKGLTFRIHPQDPVARKIGPNTILLRLPIHEIFTPLILKEEEVNHSSKGLSLDFGIPASKLRYLQITKKQITKGKETETQCYLAIHTDRIERFYFHLFEFLIQASEKEPRGSLNISHGVDTPPRLLCESSMISHLSGLVAIRNHLPSRLIYRPWVLEFSTKNDGVSLQTFYHRARNLEDSVLVIKDSKGFIFGAFVSGYWNPRMEGFSGSGEMFLFQLYPVCEIFTWDVSYQSFFLLARNDHLQIGGGGKPSLWIDQDFRHGYSGTSSTFHNAPLTPSEDFEIAESELWGFSSMELDF